MKKNLVLNEGIGNSMDKNLICCSSVNSDIVRHFVSWVLASCYVVQRSLPILPAADNSASNFAWEWGFLINNWNVISQLKLKYVD